MMPKEPVYLEGDLTFIFSYHDLQAESADRQAINKALQREVKENVFSVLGNLLPAKEVGLTQKPLSISLDESPRLHYAYRFARNKEPFIVTSRVFLVGQRIHQLNCIMVTKNVELFIAANFLKRSNSMPLITTSPETSQTGVLILNSKDLKGSQACSPAIGDLTQR